MKFAIFLPLLLPSQLQLDQVDAFSNPTTPTHIHILFQANTGMSSPSFAFTTEAEYCPAFRAAMQADTDVRATLQPSIDPSNPSPTYNTPRNGLSRFDLVRAALIGCDQSDDGILDRWYRQNADGTGVTLSVYAYSSDYAASANSPEFLLDLTENAGNRLSLAQVERNIRRLIPRGQGPTLHAVRNSAEQMAARLNRTNCYHCSNAALVIMSGSYLSNPGGPPLTFTQVPGTPVLGNQLPFAYPSGGAPCFRPNIFQRYDPQGRRLAHAGWLGWTTDSATCPDVGADTFVFSDDASRYLFGETEHPVVYTPTGVVRQTNHDALPNVPGHQRIRTFGIGVREWIPVYQALLYDMARAGGGTYVNASNLPSVQGALENAIKTAMTTVSASFSGGSALASGVSSAEDNFIYTASFRPSETGFWKGTINKYCLFEQAANQTGLCYLSTVQGGYGFAKNPSPEDQWSHRDVMAVHNEALPTGNTMSYNGVNGITAVNQLPNNLNHRPSAPTGTSPAAVNANEARADPLINESGTAKLMVQKTIFRGSSNPLGYRRIFTWGLRPDPSTGNDSYSLIQDYFPGPVHELETNHRKWSAFLYGFPLESDRGPHDAPNSPMWWNQADTPEGGLALLRYTPSCETPGSDHCYLVALTNAGLVHLFDAVTGEEIEALFPLQFLEKNVVTSNYLGELPKQPTHDQAKRFYLDGKLTLSHHDENANDVIDVTESAYLIAGFGRGGKGYLLWDVSVVTFDEFNHGFTGTSSPNVRRSASAVAQRGTPTHHSKAPKPVTFEYENAFVHLGQTWAKPWTGDLSIPNDFAPDPNNEFLPTAVGFREVAVFPSGHIPEADEPSYTMVPGTLNTTKVMADWGMRPARSICSPTTGSQEFGIPPVLCQMPSLNQIAHVLDSSIPQAGNLECTACREDETIIPRVEFTPSDSLNVIDCQCTVGTTCGSLINGQRVPCLDSSAYQRLSTDHPALAETLAREYYIEFLAPFSLQSPVFTLQTPGETMRRFRMQVDLSGLGAGHFFDVFDVEGRRIARLEGGPGIQTTPWAETSGFSFHVVGWYGSSGEKPGIDFRIVRIDYSREEILGSINHRPGIYAVDLAAWAHQPDFGPWPQQYPGHYLTPTEDVIAARFTKEDCDGDDTRSEVQAAYRTVSGDSSVTAGYDRAQLGHCFDETSGPGFSDLQYMTCPISAELAVHAPSGQFEAMYFGDECGQLWSIRKNRIGGGGFSVKRLIDLNDDLGLSSRSSTNLRKVVTKLAVVRTSDCGGGARMGIAFGTGNVQRPFARQGLTVPDTSRNYLNGRSDIVGLVWEQNDSEPTYQLSDLHQVTGNAATTNVALNRGWYLNLEEAEKSLREPLISDGIAMFQTFLPYFDENGGQISNNANAHQCAQGTGSSYLYRMDMCNGNAPSASHPAFQSLAAPPPRRELLNEQSNIGSNMEVFVSPQGQRVVFAGDEVNGGAAIAGTARPQGVSLWYWRID